MTHLISYEILTVETCPYRNLFYKQFIENLKEKESFKNSNIYFIAKTKKVRFNLEKTKLVKSTDLSTELVIGNGIKKIECSTSLYNLVDFFSQFYKTQVDFEHRLRSNSPDFIFHYNTKGSKNDMLSIELKIEGQEDFKIDIPPENFEVRCNINFENEPEILYIGQSFKMIDRIQSHKALHKAVSQIEYDEEVKIYFLNFKYGYGGIKDLAKIEGKMWNYWLNEDRKSKGYKTKIDLVERFLIHFLNPFIIISM